MPLPVAKHRGPGMARAEPSWMALLRLCERHRFPEQARDRTDALQLPTRSRRLTCSKRCKPAHVPTDVPNHALIQTAHKLKAMQGYTCQITKKPALAGFFITAFRLRIRSQPRLVAEVFKLKRLSKVTAAHNRHSTLQIITRFAGNT